MNFAEVQRIFNREYEIKFIKPNHMLIYDDDEIIIKDIQFRNGILYIYISLDNEYTE